MPAMNTPASKDQLQSGHNHPKLDSTSQPKAEEGSKPSQLARSSSSRSRLVEDHSLETAASSYGMQRWLAQGSRDEPWYAGSRICGGKSHDDKAE